MNAKRLEKWLAFRVESRPWSTSSSCHCDRRMAQQYPVICSCYFLSKWRFPTSYYCFAISFCDFEWNTDKKKMLELTAGIVWINLRFDFTFISQRLWRQLGILHDKRNAMILWSVHKGTEVWPHDAWPPASNRCGLGPTIAPQTFFINIRLPFPWRHLGILTRGPFGISPTAIALGSNILRGGLVQTSGSKAEKVSLGHSCDFMA